MEHKYTYIIGVYKKIGTVLKDTSFQRKNI